MAVTAVLTCLLSEHWRDREGQAEGSLHILLFLSCMENLVPNAGTVVSPAQQALILSVVT